MTLCIVWRDNQSVHFVSDSRGKIGNDYVDAVIKVLRIPYRIQGTALPDETPATMAEGEIGMAASGATLIAMMTKEALVEIIRNMQGVEGYNSFGMDEISSFIFIAFQEICSRYSIMGSKSNTSVIVAGYCALRCQVRAFRMDHDGDQNIQIFEEVLKYPGEVAYLGSGISIAEHALANHHVGQRTVIQALEKVIQDNSVPGVGGNVQYGRFIGKAFVVYGVARIDNGHIHHWRGPLDLNSSAFMAPGALIARFLVLDLI